jgi:hypothetical protein
VALKTKERIVAAHAKAVVRDAHQASSTGLDLDNDAVGLSVEGIFNEFFDDTGRPFDDFACRDLVRDMFGQQSNTVHAERRGRTSLSEARS